MKKARPSAITSDSMHVKIHLRPRRGNERTEALPGHTLSSSPTPLTPTVLEMKVAAATEYKSRNGSVRGSVRSLPFPTQRQQAEPSLDSIEANRRGGEDPTHSEADTIKETL